MPKILVTLDEFQDHVLETLKAKYKVASKAGTVAFLLEHFSEDLLDLEIRPEYVAKLKRNEKGSRLKFSNATELERYFAQLRDLKRTR